MHIWGRSKCSPVHVLTPICNKCGMSKGYAEYTKTGCDKAPPIKRKKQVAKITAKNYNVMKGSKFVFVRESARYSAYVHNVDLEKGLTIKRVIETGDEDQDILMCFRVNKRTPETDKKILDTLNDIKDLPRYNCNPLIKAGGVLDKPSDVCNFK